MAFPVRLQIEGHATADANGNATVTLPVGSVPPWQVWHIDQLGISLSSGSGVAVLSHGPTISAPITVDHTQLAQDNRTSPAGWDLLAGEVCTVSFSKLRPGIRCSVTLRGTQEQMQ